MFKAVNGKRERTDCLSKDKTKKYINTVCIKKKREREKENESSESSQGELLWESELGSVKADLTCHLSVSLFQRNAL